MSVKYDYLKDALKAAKVKMVEGVEKKNEKVKKAVAFPLRGRWRRSRRMRCEMNDTYNKNLLQNSQNLRKNMTKEEKHLWYDFLKNIPMNINRQKIIGNYIVDFYCSQAKLVIELDGSQHYDAEGMEYDMKRDEFLKSLGLKVLRYSNLDIRNHFESVCNDILKHLDTSSTAKAVPLPLKGKAN